MNFLNFSIATIAFAISTHAADNPAGFATEKTEHGIAVKFNGQLFTEYVASGANKPYLWPIIGPTGKTMTRAYPMKEVEGEVRDHPHHRSLWFGHEDVNGSDFWTEKATWEDPKMKPATVKERLPKLGQQVHREFREVSAGADKAVIVTVNDYIGADGKKVMEDERRFTFRADAGTRVMDVDIDFIASAGPVTFGDAKDSGFNVRVATSMSVDSKQGGRIINSEGNADKDAWGKRAKWCDFFGPVEGETVGVAMLNHPSSFRHPTPWHARTYGLFTANPFGTHSLDKSAPDGAITLKQGERLKLRHRVIFHKGDEKAAHIAEAFEQYAKETK